MQQERAKPSKTKLSVHLSSLLWVTAGLILLVFALQSAAVIWIDFVHDNPHRTQSQAVGGLFWFSIISVPLIFVGTWVIFGPSQFLLAALTAYFTSFYRSMAVVLTALPIATAVSWLCFDYLIPNDPGILAGAEFKPYENGATIAGLARMLLFQSLIWAFSIWRYYRS